MTQSTARKRKMQHSDGSFWKVLNEFILEEDETPMLANFRETLFNPDRSFEIPGVLAKLKLS
jgi:hypothetical protein